ncbi:MAG: MFS transporter [Fibrobacterota bacterium]|nr:MFS transporter [Fibrobacterota bacterium]
MVPLIGTLEFHLLLNTAVVSFIISFGLVKAVMNLVTGALADRLDASIFWYSGGYSGSRGMVMQALGIWITVWGNRFSICMVGSVLLGIGTAMVYPSLLAVVSDRTPAPQRACALGIYRFWRDLGYALGIGNGRMDEIRQTLRREGANGGTILS